MEAERLKLFKEKIIRLYPEAGILGQDFSTINRMINRLDIEKDSKATANTVPADKEPYTSTMNAFFGNVNVIGWSTRITRIKDAIMKNEIFGPKGYKISWLSKPTMFKGPEFPNYITNVYAESGYDPKEVLPDATSWSTPGSFIDKAPRINSHKYFPGTGVENTFSADIFTLLGFPKDLSFTSTIQRNNTCKVVLQISGCDAIDVTKDFASKNNEKPDYFGGNSEKNAAINIARDNDAGKVIILKYTIAKVLSDLIQILFALYKMMEMSLLNQAADISHCLFTTDEVVSARCRMMGLASCVQDHGTKIDKNVHCVYYYPIHASDAAVNEAYIKRTSESDRSKAILNNDKIIHYLSSSRTLLLGTETRILNDLAIGYLVSISEQIRNANIHIKTLIVQGNDLKSFQKELLNYTAITLINEKGKITQTARRLFPPGGTAAGVEDIIFKNRRHGDTFALQISRLLPRLTVRDVTRASHAFGAFGGTRKIRKNKPIRTRRSKRNYSIGGAAHRVHKGPHYTKRRGQIKLRSPPKLKPKVPHFLLKDIAAAIGLNASRDKFRLTTPPRSRAAAAVPMNVHEVSASALGVRMIDEQNSFLSETCNKDNTLLKDFFTSLRSIDLEEEEERRLTPNEIEDFLYITYNYFVYIGETPLDPDHLSRIYKRFDQDWTLETFESEYNKSLDAIKRATPLSEEEIITRDNTPVNNAAPQWFVK